MIILFIAIIALLAWGIKLIRLDLKILENENSQLKITIKKLLERNSQ